MKPPNLLQELAQGGVGGGSSLLWTQVTESRGVCREFKSNKMDSGLGSADPEVDGNTQSGKRTRTGEHTISKVLFRAQFVEPWNWQLEPCQWETEEPQA